MCPVCVPGSRLELPKEGKICPVELVAEVKKCGAQKDLQRGKLLHSKAVDAGLQKNIYVSNTLILMYSRCNDLSNARAVFDCMEHRSIVSWNVLLLGYVENGHSLLALELFNRMNQSPDPFTFAAVIKACIRLVSKDKSDKEICLEKGMKLHKQATELGFDRDIVVASSLVDMYSKAGDMNQARSVFDTMKNRNVVTWTTLIAGYVDNGRSSEALAVYNVMDSQPNPFTFAAALRACGNLGALRAGQRIHSKVCKYGCEQDETVATCLVDFYGKCGVMAAAEAVFNRMHNLDIVSWSSLIGGYSLLGETSRVFCLVREMQGSGLRVDSVTMLLVLKACNHAGMVREGERYFQAMGSKCGMSPAVEHYGCMVDMLGRANRLEEALNLVKKMPCKADGVIWTGLLLACRRWSNMEVGRVAFQAVVDLDEDKGSVAAAYVLMRKIHESLGLEQESEQLEAERRLFGSWEKKKKKKLGISYWCDAQGVMHQCGEDLEDELEVKDKIQAIKLLVL